MYEYEYDIISISSILEQLLPSRAASLFVILSVILILHSISLQ